MLPLLWIARLITTLVITDLTQTYRRQEAISFLPNRYLVSLKRDESISLEDLTIHCTLMGDFKYLEDFVHVEKISQVQRISRASTFDERVIDTPIDSTPSLYPPQVQTRITELHNMGVYGQGVKVALSDTGVDCSHPALGNGFGPGFKIGFGKDLAIDESKDDEEGGGESTNPQARGNRKAQPRKIDEGPCTHCPGSSHGTHAAGIVAASDIGFGFIGVAPNVTLGVYQGQLLSVMNNLVQNKGSIIVVAAANDGEEGLFHASIPASARMPFQLVQSRRKP
ncbi:hypothetical protein PCASD_17589 [Puccinia coronata f. sp. avenae]|uniref:Peptidase S8/S53 domain-containing protein n=2 Tax=Puccinia coronata f. sp. avenae TaxID=200324 RepID=A0A2N5T6X4_9BASI|nr:hypothetical protein PCASD_17589 [Puccinia coronata f. sp. avenae]